MPKTGQNEAMEGAFIHSLPKPTRHLAKTCKAADQNQQIDTLQEAVPNQPIRNDLWHICLASQMS